MEDTPQLKSPLLQADKGRTTGTSLAILTPQLNVKVTREHHQVPKRYYINKSSYHIY